MPNNIIPESGDTSQYLDRCDPIPLREQLDHIIRLKISTGEWKPDKMIPSEKSLCSIYGVSRVTVRNVILQLVSEGLLYRISGKGTYVCEPKIEITNLSNIGLRKQLEAQGHQVTTRLLSICILSNDESISQKLKIKPNEEFYLVERVRSVNNIPVCYYKSYFPVKLCPDLEHKDIASKPLLDILRDEYHLNRTIIDETLESYIADPAKAEILGITPGFPLLLLEDSVSDTSGLHFEYCQVFFRGDKIKLNLHYQNQ